MITVTTAKKIIADNLLVTPVITCALQEALYLRLARPVHSPANVPAYAQSGMDGYAFAFADWQRSKQLSLSGVMAAGATNRFLLPAGHAARIFTGAPLPEGADTVIMQEKTAVTDNVLNIHDDNTQQGNSVRLPGSAIKAGELALPANSLLTPGAIGFLAGMGVHEVEVYAPPTVSIIVTGNELQQPGHPLAFGEVYESNSYAIQALLRARQIHNMQVYHVNDELEAVQRVLETALASSDMVLLTGGVSVGDFDFVVEAAAACGVQQLFHRIKQRPGKPLFAGRKEQKLVFGLPGNPSSVLTCMYEYVLPCLQAGITVITAPLAEDVKKPAGLTHFLKAFFDGLTVEVLNAQESYRMSSFAVANCLVVLEEETTSCSKGDMVTVHLLNP